MKPPPILSSPKTSLMLLLVMVMVIMRSYTINKQLITLQNDLDNAYWRIVKGSQHRTELLNQIETAKLERKQLEGNGVNVE